MKVSAGSVKSFDPSCPDVQVRNKHRNKISEKLAKPRSHATKLVYVCMCGSTLD